MADVVKCLVNITTCYALFLARTTLSASRISCNVLAEKNNKKDIAA